MEKILVGKVLKSVGLKGEIKVQPYFKKKFETVIISDFEYKVLKYREYKDFVFLYLDGITTIEQADRLKGQEIFVVKENVIIDEDEILLEDLIGYKVLGDNGKDFGLVTGVLKYTGQVILECGSVVIPYEEAFIVETNFDTKTIVVMESRLIV